MKTKVTIDKSSWPSGPWQDEPDEADWTDEVTGYFCMIRRVPWLGTLCGYVRVPDDHLLHGMDHHDKIERLSKDVELHESFGPMEVLLAALDHEEGRVPISLALKVHGNVTWSGQCPGYEGWFFGFDCSHVGDLAMLQQRSDPVMGPILSPLGEFETYRTFEYVKSECQSLAEQLLRLA